MKTIQFDGFTWVRPDRERMHASLRKYHAWLIAEGQPVPEALDLWMLNDGGQH